jgi:hypothetical protein
MNKLKFVCLPAALAVICAAAALSLAVGSDPMFKTLYIQGEKVNIRVDQSVSAPVLVQMKSPDCCDVLDRGKQENIGGKLDYWYRIKFYDKEKPKTGWVFGAFTSLSLTGRRTAVMEFIGCEGGDMLEHRIFRDASGRKWDFSDMGDNLEGYELCEASRGGDSTTVSTGSKKYAGKKFELVLNDLMLHRSCFDDPAECGRQPLYSRISIIFLRLMK